MTKIPTIVGLLLTASFVGVIIFFGEKYPVLSLLASRGITAENIQITNLTDSSFALSWTTGESTIGDVIVTGENASKLTALDDRDGQAKKIPAPTHHVTVRNLSPETSYWVVLRNNGRMVDGPPQHVQTLQELPPGGDNALGPAYGSVMTNENTPAAGALVYLTVDGGQTLSTLVTSSGSWLIALNRLRTQNGALFTSPLERITEEITVKTIPTQDTQATTDTLNDSPVPAMIIGKSYDFRKQQAKTTSDLASVLGTTTNGIQASTVSLVSPENGAAIPGTKPLIGGTGIPEKTVVLTLGITQPYSDTTKVGSDGLWRYTPEKPFGIGKQSITMTTVDNSGKPVAITHVFEILKNGTQVLGVATPSATLEPTQGVTPTATLSGQPLPTSGSTLPTLLLIVAGMTLIAFGTVLIPR